MCRLVEAIKSLDNKGYQITKTTRLRGGVNSAVYKAECSKGFSYALKIYPLTSAGDPRNRCLTETNFLSYLRSCEVSNIPMVLNKDIENGWALISWIDGEKPKSLKPRNLFEITDFIASINKPSKEPSRTKLMYASEACVSLPQFTSSIDQRFKKIDSVQTTNETTAKAKNWASNVLLPHFRSIKEDILDRCLNQKYWRNLNDCKVASPSDVGIHNTIQTKQGLYFIDFEYAGLDDLSKLAADWIMHPEYQLNKEMEKIFIESLKDKLRDQFNFGWEKRLADIKPLIHMKWCLIMLNRIHSNQLTNDLLAKANKYYQKMSA